MFGSIAWETRCRYRTEEEMGFDLLCGGVYKGITKPGLTGYPDISKVRYFIRIDIDHLQKRVRVQGNGGSS